MTEEIKEQIKHTENYQIDLDDEFSAVLENQNNGFTKEEIEDIEEPVFNNPEDKILWRLNLNIISRPKAKRRS